MVQAFVFRSYERNAYGKSPIVRCRVFANTFGLNSDVRPSWGQSAEERVKEQQQNEHQPLDS